MAPRKQPPKVCYMDGCEALARGGRGLCKRHWYRWRTHGDPNIVAKYQPTKTDPTRLDQLRELSKIESNECTIWRYALDDAGYPTLRYDGKTKLGHAVVCAWTHGERPIGMEAAHECGNPPCVNPRHLAWKSRTENEADKVHHLTSNRGRGKLSEENVHEIRRRLKAGESQGLIAEDFPIGKTMISLINRNCRWQWLEQE